MHLNCPPWSFHKQPPLGEGLQRTPDPQLFQDGTQQYICFPTKIKRIRKFFGPLVRISSLPKWKMNPWYNVSACKALSLVTSIVKFRSLMVVETFLICSSKYGNRFLNSTICYVRNVSIMLSNHTAYLQAILLHAFTKWGQKRGAKYLMRNPKKWVSAPKNNIFRVRGKKGPKSIFS